jgi:hypothetical protein
MTGFFLICLTDQIRPQLIFIIEQEHNTVKSYVN